MRLPVGQSDFGKVISRFRFIDKSLFIKEIIEDDDVILITRPRRFGKTLNLSMLRYFFTPEVNGEPTRPLFDQLEIAKHPACMKYQGKHPVISISFKEVKENTFPKVYAGIRDVVRKMYDDHDYLLTSNALKAADKANYESILNQQASEINLKSSLKNLTVYLHRHYGADVVVLIDEYDTPIQSGYLHNFYDEIVSFFRHFLSAGLKDNDRIFKGILTGILRVSQESLFSGLNNLISYSMLHPRYAPYFGFTEPEVENMLEESELLDKLKDVKAWYNGYQIGEHVLYNPWSIANYIKDRDLQPYWINTSDNILIKNLFLQSSDEFKRRFEPLLKGGYVEQVIDQFFVYPQLKKNLEAALWSFLFMAGYLKVTECQNSKRGPKCKLAIPNKEVSNLYRTMIEEWLSGEKGFDWYERYLAHLLEGNMPEFEKSLKYVMERTVSFHDTSKEPEAFYHGFIIGITASLCDSKIYELRSNRESGEGRYDYFIVSRDPKNLSILMEFKRISDSDTGKLKEAAKAAMAQIDQKKYLVEAEQWGIKKLLKIGIAFSGKTFELESQQVNLNDDI